MAASESSARRRQSGRDEGALGDVVHDRSGIEGVVKPAKVGNAAGREEREQAKHAPQPDQPVLSGDRAQGVIASVSSRKLKVQSPVACVSVSTGLAPSLSCVPARPGWRQARDAARDGALERYDLPVVHQ